MTGQPQLRVLVERVELDAAGAVTGRQYLCAIGITNADRPVFSWSPFVRDGLPLTMREARMVRDYLHHVIKETSGVGYRLAGHIEPANTQEE